MQEDRINYLTEKFFRDACSDSELLELAALIKQNPDEELVEVLQNAWAKYDEEAEMPEKTSERILAKIFPAKIVSLFEDENEQKIMPVRLRQATAAAAILILGFGLYWWLGLKESSKMADQNTRQTTALADLPPGGNKAVLTLGDGSEIILDSAKNGNLGNQGNSNITKSKTGELIYNEGSAKAVNAIVFNTLTTPKGGQYHIVLPDGSGVWLNAASSLKFPTSFTGKERRVEITGEVYFEVMHNAKMPFIVKINETEVAVLGTHFNVMAYPDEKTIKTTLLEGAVKVSRAGKSATLSPGQQASITNSVGNINVLANVDTEKEMAWKNGYFQFEDENLESIMRQVARWYDVDVNYDGNMSKEHFTGRLPRNANVSKVLKILSLSGVKFRIENKTINVTP